MPPELALALQTPPVESKCAQFPFKAVSSKAGIPSVFLCPFVLNAPYRPLVSNS